MSWDRFLATLTMLHLNTNEEKMSSIRPCYNPLHKIHLVIILTPGYDPLHKICPVINTLTIKFQDVNRPEKVLAIDEAICSLRGCIYFHVYMKGEPHKYGIKTFEMCYSKSGYACTLKHMLAQTIQIQISIAPSMLSTNYTHWWRTGATPFTWTSGFPVRNFLIIYGKFQLSKCNSRLLF